MIKINKKGFAFSELLMVTVVIIGIFMIIYTNIFPIMGELENREKYNDISANYAAFYLRKVLLDQKLSVSSYSILYSKDGNKVDKLLINYTDYLENADVEKVVLTKGNISDLKEEINNDDLSDVSGYIDYLPIYNNLNGREEQYRLIVKTSTGFATTLINLSKDDYEYMFVFDDNDSNVILGIKKLDNSIIRIPDFVTGIEGISNWGEIEVIYLNSLIKGSNNYINLSNAFNSFGNSSANKKLTLKIYDCKKGEQDEMKNKLGIQEFISNISVECLQEVANEEA